MDEAVRQTEGLTGRKGFSPIHITRKQYLPGIKEHGLQPHSAGITGKDKPPSYQTDKVFYGDNISGWGSKLGFTYGDAVLRPKYTPKDLAPDVHAAGMYGFKKNYQSRQPVAPQDLEIKLPDGTWEDLLTYMKKKP
jgi:hypothetical protein